jgi:hypothetical protein
VRFATPAISGRSEKLPSESGSRPARGPEPVRGLLWWLDVERCRHLRHAAAPSDPGKRRLGGLLSRPAQWSGDAPAAEVGLGEVR